MLALSMANIAAVSQAKCLQEDGVPNQPSIKIKLVDIDGQPIKGIVVQAEQDETEPPPTEIKPAEGGQNAPAALAGKPTMVIEDGVVLLRNPDGTTERIVPRKMTVTESVRSVMIDGEMRTERIRRATVVDANGQVYEADVVNDPRAKGLPALRVFGNPDQLDIQRFPEQPKTLTLTLTNRFWAGVRVEPASEQLRSHLNLESGQGLVVMSVMSDSPAELAGIQKHDVLLFADDRQLESIQDWAEEIDRAGVAKEEIALIVVRSGKEINIELKPEERPEVGFKGDQLEKLQNRLNQNNFPGRQPPVAGLPMIEFDFREAGPGFVLDLNGERAAPEELLQRFEEMRAERLQDLLKDNPAKNLEQTKQVIEELRAKALEWESRANEQRTEMNELMMLMRQQMDALKKKEQSDKE